MRKSEDGSLVWMPEEDRVRRVVVKLARGHAAYELSLPQIDDPIGRGSLASGDELLSLARAAQHRAAGAHPFAEQRRT